MTRIQILAAIYVAIAAIMLLWDILLAGRIAQLRRAPRAFAAITAFAGLLLAPALLIAFSTGSILYGRAIQPVNWVWPLTTVLFALQGMYALSRRLVTPLFGVPVAVYNIIIAVVAVSRFIITRGGSPPDFGLALSAAQASSLGIFFGPAALYGPGYLQVPIFSPSLPARWRMSGFVRAAIAAAAAFFAGLVLIGIPAAFEAARSYGRYANEQLQEHPEGDFDIGLKVLPDLRGLPPVIAMERDAALADSLQVDAIKIVVHPEAAGLLALDSVARIVDDARGDSVLVIVSLGYPKTAAKDFKDSPSEYTRRRVRDVDRIARRLRPDILIPAEDPNRQGALAIGPQPPAYWIDYLTRAADVAHYVNRRIRVAVAASSYGPRDSTLYFWAARQGSPIDVVGLTLLPGFDGARSLDTEMRVAQRWMRQLGARAKPHWVLGAGGYPMVHGERNQELALWGTLAWATTQAPIKGLVVVEAGDYNAIRGLRAASGRLRPSAAAVMRAKQGLRETVRPERAM